MAQVSTLSLHSEHQWRTYPPFEGLTHRFYLGLSVESARPVAFMHCNTPVHSGTYQIDVNKCPSGDTFLSYLSSGKKVLLAKWQEREIRLTLKPACDHCGAEGHSDGKCPYWEITQLLTAKMDSIRTAPSASTSHPHGFTILDNLSVSNKPDSKKGTKHPVVTNTSTPNRPGPSKFRKKK